MPLVYRGRYWLTDLLNDFENDFLVFYLRGLHGFDFDGHIITSLKNITVFGKKVKRTSEMIARECLFQKAMKTKKYLNLVNYSFFKHNKP